MGRRFCGALATHEHGNPRGHRTSWLGERGRAHPYTFAPNFYCHGPPTTADHGRNRIWTREDGETGCGKPGPRTPWCRIVRLGIRIQIRARSRECSTACQEETEKR